MKVTATKVGKSVGAVFLALLAGVSMPLLVWVAIIIAFRQIFAEWRATRVQLLSGNLICSINADCPPGYQCIGGRCSPKPSPIARNFVT